MKLIHALSTSFTLFIATCAVADNLVPFVDTPTGQTARTQAWLITTTEAEGKIDYAVVVRGDTGDWHVIPAILITKVPNDTLGRPSVITATVEEELVGSASPKRRLRVTKIKPIAW